MPEPGKPLDKAIVDEAYRRYADGESINSIAKALHTTGVTLHKYKKKQGWVRRVKKVENKLRDKADSEILKRRKRHLAEYGLMQKNAVEALQDTVDEEGNIKKGLRPKSYKNAVTGLDTGIKGEREVLGDSEQDEMTITLKLPKGMKMEDLCQSP